MRPTLVEVALLAVLGLARVATTHIIMDTDYVAQAVKRGAVLWDVRIEEEFKTGHVHGAVNMDDFRARAQRARETQ